MKNGAHDYIRKPLDPNVSVHKSVMQSRCGRIVSKKGGLWSFSRMRIANGFA